MQKNTESSARGTSCFAMKSVSESMEDILQPSNRSYSAGTNRLKMCCSPTYQVRRLRNKAAILILVWNYLGLSVLNYLSLYPYIYIFGATWHLCCILWVLTLPIAGWLADVRLGRYKVIRWSMLFVWMASVLIVASSVLSQFVESYSHINNRYIITVLLFIVCIACGAYQANIILYGIDQLQDASTEEITSFISWYMCTWYGSEAIHHITHLYLSTMYYGRLLEEFTTCICLTLMVISALAFDKVFLKEPITQNPFQLIYKVIKYAIKTKHPRCRSAFTYCEDELPSRIDFGKHKYGGPFTTEEVENVKTFLRILVVIFVGSVVSSGMFSFNTGFKLISNSDQEGTSLFTWITTVDIAYFNGALLIVLHEFLFYPLLQKSLSCIQSYRWKLSVGVVSQIARVVALMAIDLTARHNYVTKCSNSTIQCIFAEKSGILSSNFNMKWIILPHLLNSVSLITLIVGVFEFICSQSPYSMRGLLFGAIYGIVLFYNVIGYGIFEPFTRYAQSTVWGTGIISCEFWFLLLVLLFLVGYAIMSRVLMKWYKNRKREDVLPNEQIFAERYYTRY